MATTSTRTDKILVVDDDARIRDLLRRYLTQEGFEIMIAEDGKALNRILLRETVDLIVLDLMMPGEDGLSICRRLRSANDRTPIIMQTAKGEDVDRIVGLEVGADDYLVKPFQKDELLARLNALVRRSAGFISPRVKAGDYELDLSRKELTIAGEVTVLTSFEYLILEYLMRNARQVVSKQQLLDQLYGDGEGDPNTIEVMVSRLRKKLDPEGTIQPISTIRRQGYIFNLSCN